jgi:hypothetical protein
MKTNNIDVLRMVEWHMVARNRRERVEQFKAIHADSTRTVHDGLLGWKS